jgi:hypothetical protein
MSEYQYYEFVAVDRPLSEREQRELRAISSRATITSTRFSNSYSYGDLKAQPAKLVERYFDAHLYLANWGTRRLTLRLPARLLDPEVAKRYCGRRVRTKGEHVIVDLWSEEEQSEWIDEEDGPSELAALLPVRAELAGGDHRALYLGWLLRVQDGEIEDSEEEPPCPPGLRSPSAALEAMIEFLRIDRDLVAAAVTRSRDVAEIPRSELERWLGSLPDAERTALLVGLMEGSDPHLRSEALRRFHERLGSRRNDEADSPRTVAQIVADAERVREERERIEAEKAAKERARREREAAEARTRELDALAKREAAAWAEVDAHIATKLPRRYDEAVKLLGDLRDLGARRGDAAAIDARIRRLCDEHASKPSFLRRLRPPEPRGAPARRR